MDKLTWYDNDGRIMCRRGYEVALARLASYEAAGLTPEQVVNAKTITGLNTNTYLRKLIMGEHLCPRPPDTYTALLRELSAIGNNINQIAHWTNGKGYATQAEIHEAVSLVKQAYRRILDTL